MAVNMIRRLFSITALTLSLSTACYAQGPNTYGQDQPPYAASATRTKQIILSQDPIKQELIDVLPYRPELMHLDYLEHLIGRPYNEVSERFCQKKNYFWYDNDHQVNYELHQFEERPGAVVSSTFIIHMPESRASFAQVEARYGGDVHRIYDRNLHVSQIYSFAPYTSITFGSPQESWRVEQAQIMYKGPALPRPSQEELSYVEESHIGRLVPPYVRQGRWDIPIPPLVDHLKRHPYDGEARFALAQAHRVHGNLDVAINEYKTAYACAGDDDGLRSRCVAGLAELRAIPGPMIAQPSGQVITNYGNRMKYLPYDPYDHSRDRDQQQQYEPEQQSQLAGVGAPPM